MKTYLLNSDIISRHINDFLCSYGDVDFVKIISNANYLPQSFVIDEKRLNQSLLFFPDVSYDMWLRNMVFDQIENTRYPSNDKSQLIIDATKNIEALLDYSHNGHPVSSCIFNQEFVDVIRRVIYFTINGNTDSTLDTAELFNKLSDKILPFVISTLREERPHLVDLFMLSVASGVSGLDLKGAPAAASSYANTGIAMKPYLDMPPKIAACDYFSKLRQVVSFSQSPIFAWNEFSLDIEGCKKLVWMTDDYIESHFDLLFISRLLDQYKNLRVEIIPKNGLYGNDLSSTQLLSLINNFFFDDLIPFINEDRLSINDFGPRMGAANIRKFSRECIQSLSNSDVLLMKGCRIHEMLQGGLNINSYSAFIVSRAISEITTGLDSEKLPIVLCHLKPKEYAFWGISPSISKSMLLFNGRKMVMCASTLLDHEKRKNLSDPQEIIAEFRFLEKLQETYDGDKAPLYGEMNMLANKLVMITKSTYDNMCAKYKELRQENLHKMDQNMWNNLERYISMYIAKPAEKVNMLDVATGSGRDILYAYSRGYNIIGVDNSEGFIDILRKLHEEERIPDGSFANNDMRSLQFPDSSFDVVRHNASLLHLPIIASGYMADQAISEARRVLVDGGLLYVFVKKGDTLQFVDTGEGLGGRVFQFYSHDTINSLLQRHMFTILYTSDEIEERPSGNVEWISVIAQKTS